MQPLWQIGIEIMRKRNLKSCSIIPHELYVDRGADSDLNNVIEEMGRPGYILVARQMGKTNLLLHARDFWNSRGDSFIYIDLTNKFGNIRDLFRSIIDTATESMGDKSTDMAEEISNSRLHSSTIPPHKEHERELRVLLKNIGRRLVICLDEIDALMSVSYSDVFFSFIRSSYFSGRANFPEFNKLTYVLSGVAEPSDLIKNKDISPFNIGEKIVLDDFSFEEFNQFTLRAGLKLSESVLTRIYYWINGNPRMTWDVCSRIEGLLLDGTDISPTTVDEIINKLYLTSYDIPPVDHIRNLAANDKSIRDAVIEIYYGRENSISDYVLNRLSLAGIVRIESKEGRIISFRNNLITELLSEDWIFKHDVKDETYLINARDELKLKHYNEATSLFKSALELNRSFESLHGIGQCDFYLGKYDRAIARFEEALSLSSKNNSQVASACFFAGLASFRQNDYEVGFEYFTRQIDSKSELVTDLMDLEALLYQAWFLLEEKNDCTAALNCCEKIFTIADSYLAVNDHDSGRKNELICMAHYVSFKCNIKLGVDSEALSELNLAATLANFSQLLFINLEKYIFENEISIVNLHSIVDGIMSHGIVPVRESFPFSISFSLDCLERLFKFLLEKDDGSSVDRLVEYFESSKALSGNELAELLATVMGTALAEAKSASYSAILTPLLRLPIKEEDEVTLRQAIAASILANINRDFYIKFVDRFVKGKTGPVTLMEIRFFWIIISDLISDKNYTKANDCIHSYRLYLFDSLEDVDLIDSSMRLANFLLLCLEVSIFTGLADKEKTRELLSRVNAIKADVSNDELPYFGSGFVRSEKDKINRLTAMYIKMQPIRRNTPKLQRNDKVKVLYSDGTEISGKYKKFENDIKLNKCKLIISI